MEIIEFGNADASTILIQPIDKHDRSLIEKEIDMIRESASENFRLVAFVTDDWNNDLSPWEAPAVFGKDGFGGGAEKTLQEIISYCDDKTKTYYIGGYSLAGLFALWAAYRTDVFTGVAAASPSVWFPGFTDHIGEKKPGCERVYLSLGDKEEKTRNEVMSTVGAKIRLTYKLLSSQGVDCVLEWNEGNHFKDPHIRTAKAFSWIIGKRDKDE